MQYLLNPRPLVAYGHSIDSSYTSNSTSCQIIIKTIEFILQWCGLSRFIHSTFWDEFTARSIRLCSHADAWMYHQRYIIHVVKPRWEDPAPSDWANGSRVPHGLLRRKMSLFSHEHEGKTHITRIRMNIMHRIIFAPSRSFAAANEPCGRRARKWCARENAFMKASSWGEIQWWIEA